MCLLLPRASPGDLISSHRGHDSKPGITGVYTTGTVGSSPFLSLAVDEGVGIAYTGTYLGIYAHAPNTAMRGRHRTMIPKGAGHCIYPYISLAECQAHTEVNVHTAGGAGGYNGRAVCPAISHIYLSADFLSFWYPYV